jgi:hypothetical protein
MYSFPITDYIYKFSKSQYQLYRLVKQILPTYQVKFNDKHYDIVFSSKRVATLDIYIPELALAIEYQGEFHYKTSNVFGRDRRREDAVKRSLALAYGM